VTAGRRTFVLVLLAAGSLLAGCGERTQRPASTLDKATRDSVLAESALPGAGAVKGALGAADSAQIRAERAAEASRR
jgi:hypothetical protein